MNKLILYHGTDCVFNKIDLCKSAPSGDFGCGFYTTTRLFQAEKWAREKKKRTGSEKLYMYVYEAEADDTVCCKEFPCYSEEWLEFIRKNRNLGGLHHPYDIVSGPLDNNDTVETVAAYVSGVISSEEALFQLYSSHNSDDQVSFHTEKALSCLRLIKMYPFE